ncbi:GNAT family N-acetyltransferase [Clostridium sp. 'deep sea']|uniref:GNAT family N-acetyltransferase n=1 Tax=Clostridium sp. 'deep sea' TaxID=2779445 RepID=UPI0018969B14|nr:GNAT family N-acetyltransferase [Clostridium sp. 'deep sea']QOR34389.1 GNAT family N-acetyltransferase [Clostridium sp. 'deep sea']
MLNHIGTQTIETGNLFIRRFKKQDIKDAFNNWVTEKEVVKFLSCPVHSSIEVTASVITDWIQCYEKHDFYQWAIVPKDYKKAIGTISIMNIQNTPKRCEIGYCIGKDYWGKGYTTEALKAVIHYALFDINFNRVEAMFYPLYKNSGKVMSKAGMQYEGLFRKYAEDNSDKIIYSILQQDLFNKNIKQEFIKTPIYSDSVIELRCSNHVPANTAKKHLPYYVFSIKVIQQNSIVGVIHLRLGFNEGIYYCGHIGYLVDDKYQNKGYATRACLLIKELAKQHGYKNLLITNNPENIASRKVCEKIGADFIRVVELPVYNELRKQGESFKCIYQWQI